MKLYIKEYFGIYCSGGCIIVAAHNAKEADEVTKKYHGKKLCFCYEPSEVEKAKVIRYSEYHGKVAKVLVDNIVQE
jgi:hypothetical protein